MTEIIYSPEREKYMQAIETLDNFCDNDERKPYYDIKPHYNGKSIYLTIRFKGKPRVRDLPYSDHAWQDAMKKEKKRYKNKVIFGKSRREVTILAAEYVRGTGVE